MLLQVSYGFIVTVKRKYDVDRICVVGQLAFFDACRCRKIFVVVYSVILPKCVVHMKIYGFLSFSSHTYLPVHSSSNLIQSDKNRVTVDDVP